ncbi:MAG: DUF6020 family protein [Ruminococcus sp.]|nr:DUF6020 family protein [Ruminococcus sp.]
MENKNDPHKVKNLSDIKWLPYVFSVMSAYGFSMYLNFDTANQFILIFVALLIPLFRKRYSQQFRFCASSGICALLISFLTVFSAKATMIPENAFTQIDNSSNLVLFFIIFYFFYEALFYVIYQKMLKIKLYDENKVITKKGRLKVFFGAMLIMLIIWLPFFIYYYPGLISGDSNWQLKQAAGISPLSNHHPVMHTLLIKIFWDLGQWLFDGNDTASVALYSFFQQLALSACFAYLIETLYVSKVKKKVLIAVLAFYTIPAYHAIYSITMWKDILFGGIAAVMTALIWRLLNKGDKFKLSVSEGIMLFVFSLSMCLMRSNGLYAFMLLLPAAAVVFFKRNKLTVVLMTAALSASLIITGPVYGSLGITPVDTVESLSIPLQLISNVAKEPDNLNDEQRELLDKVVDVDRIGDEYYPTVSDNIKNLVREKENQEYITEHKFEYLKLFFELGIEHPKLYIEAYANQTFGYWFPDVQYWVFLIRRDSEPFDIPDVPQTSLSEALETIINSYKGIMFYGLLWSIGFAVWVFIFMAGAASVRHKKSVLLVYLPVFGVYITLLIATPVYSEFRYIYSLFTSLPMFCIVPFLDIMKNTETKTDKNEKIAEITEKA